MTQHHPGAHPRTIGACRPLGRRALRRGQLLILVLVAIVLVAGLLTTLAVYAAQSYRDRQADRARFTARTLAQSAAAYAREHAANKMTAPAGPITLDVTDLLPTNTTGSATIDFPQADGGRVCRITGKAECGRSEAFSEVEVDLGK